MVQEIDKERVVSCEAAKIFKEIHYNRECKYTYTLDKNGNYLNGPIHTNIRDNGVKLENFEVLLAPTVEEAINFFEKEYQYFPVVRPYFNKHFIGEIFDLRVFTGPPGRDEGREVVFFKIYENREEAIEEIIKTTCDYAAAIYDTQKAF